MIPDILEEMRLNGMQPSQALHFEALLGFMRPSAKCCSDAKLVCDSMLRSGQPLTVSPWSQLTGVLQE